jgi:CRP-like cAMP-binding protein
VSGGAALVLLSLLVLGPLGHGVGELARAAARWVQARIDAVRFRAQRGWRIEAGERMAALAGGDDPLDDDALNELAGRVQRRRFAAGQVIVRQGDAADRFFIIRRGRCEVAEVRADGTRAVVTHLGEGASFGELALLEGTPRTATVTAVTAGEVFVLDAGAFKRLLAPSLVRGPLASDQWEVSEVWRLPPFRSLGLDAAGRVAREGSWISVAPGDVVVRKGQVGDAFYAVASGQLEVKVGRKVESVLRAGDHFGEIALLRDSPRTATVRAVTPARLFVLRRPAFDALVRASFDGGRRRVTHGARTHSAARRSKA